MSKSNAIKKKNTDKTNKRTAKEQGKNLTTNILLCGVGGQGVILASTIISHAALKSGYDVKKSEVHGMSQRGGAVTSHIRIGKKVYSPLIPGGEADFLVSLNPTEKTRNEHQLKDQGRIIECPLELIDQLDDIRSLNVCTVGILSNFLNIKEDVWKSALKDKIKESLYDKNVHAFDLGKEYGSKL